MDNLLRCEGRYDDNSLSSQFSLFVALIKQGSIRAVHQGHVLAMVIFDFSSSFDAVDYIPRYVLSLFPGLQSLDRHLFGLSPTTDQRFTTNYSPSVALTAGVPQGSDLDSTQFTAYRADTASIIKFNLPSSIINICRLTTVTAYLVRFQQIRNKSSS